MYEVVYVKLIELCTDICKRKCKKKLLWFGDKDKSLSYQPKEDEMLITVHRWFANKSCLGAGFMRDLEIWQQRLQLSLVVVMQK